MTEALKIVVVFPYCEDDSENKLSFHSLPDTINNSNSNILNRSEQVLVSNEVSPHRTAVGSTNVLREMIKEHGVNPGKDGGISVNQIWTKHYAYYTGFTRFLNPLFSTIEYSS